LLALPKKEARHFHWQKKDHERQPGAALVMVDTRPEIDEARFARSMAEIKIVDRIDVSARIVKTSIANRKRAEEIEKTGHEVAQARTQIQDIGRGNNREATGLEHAMDFAQEKTRLFEVFDGFDAGDQTKATIEIWQFAGIEINDVHSLCGIVHQRIGIITGSGAQPETGANGTNEFAFAATNVEPFAGQGRLDIRCRDCGHHRFLYSRSAYFRTGRRLPFFPQPHPPYDLANAQRKLVKMPGALPRNAFEHFGVGGEFFHEHQQTLNCFTWFVTGETAPNQIDLFQLPRLQKQFFAPGAGKENIDRRINAL